MVNECQRTVGSERTQRVRRKLDVVNREESRGGGGQHFKHEREKGCPHRVSDVLLNAIQRRKSPTPKCHMS